MKEIRGIKPWMGALNLFFQPLKEYKAFKYIEKRNKPEDKIYTTSFRLHLTLTPPQKASLSLSEIEWSDYKLEVVQIAWSEKEAEKDSGYYWAISLCEDIKTDLGIKPVIVDTFNIERKEYQCSFIEGEKILDIRYRYKTKNFDLSYVQPILKKKKDAAEEITRKMRMNEIRPY